MDMSEILPTNDVMFKIIFGNPKHSDILIRFLNSVIEHKDSIKAVDIMKDDFSLETAEERGVRLDIVATTNSGEIINVEIQKTKQQENIVNRVLFYWSRLFSGQLVKGEVKKTISINILDFNLFKDERYWRKWHLKDTISKENLSELLEIHVIELNKMGEIDKNTPLTFWIEFFKNPYSDKVEAMFETVPEIKTAREIFERAKYDPAAQESMKLSG